MESLPGPFLWIDYDLEYLEMSDLLACFKRHNSSIFRKCFANSFQLFLLTKEVQFEKMSFEYLPMKIGGIMGTLSETNIACIDRPC